MLLTSPKIPSILRHITVATSACHPVSEPPAITLQSSLGNSLVSAVDQQNWSVFFQNPPPREGNKGNKTTRLAHRGHLEFARLSCGASGPAAGVCASACDRRGRRSAWRERASGSENRQASAWAMRSQNLDSEMGARSFAFAELLMWAREEVRPEWNWLAAKYSPVTVTVWLRLLVSESRWSVVKLATSCSSQATPPPRLSWSSELPRPPPPPPDPAAPPHASVLKVKSKGGKGRRRESWQKKSENHWLIAQWRWQRCYRWACTVQSVRSRSTTQ